MFDDETKKTNADHAARSENDEHSSEHNAMEDTEDLTGTIDAVNQIEGEGSAETDSDVSDNADTPVDGEDGSTETTSGINNDEDMLIGGDDDQVNPEGETTPLPDTDKEGTSTSESGLINDFNDVSDDADDKQTEPLPETDSKSSGGGIFGKKPKKKPRKKRRKREPIPKSTWLPALIGGIVGAAVVAAVVLIILLYTGILGGSTTTTNKIVVNGDNETETAIEAVAQTVPDSVVGITTEVSEETMMGTESGTAMGSGFIVTSDGYIATNEHIISDSTGDITVEVSDGTTYTADVVWSDSSLDLAVIKIDAKNLTAVTLGDSDDVQVGQTVIAIGNPISLQYERSVTSGIVSALNRSLTASDSDGSNQIVAENLIQTDAAINSGNSGGPLCNTSGEVIGINAYKSSQGENMGFAIPINILKPIINKIVSTGSFTPTVMGITGYDSEQAYYMSETKIQFDKGIYVTDVSDGAADAGLKEGDIITAVNGTEVNTMLQLKTVLYALDPGDTVEVTYTRNGSSHTVDVTLSEGSSESSSSSSDSTNQSQSGGGIQIPLQ